MGRTVLIVEDDKSVGRLLADVLEAEGYQALIETDGEWGLRTFQHKDVDLVITDVLLPKLRGFDLVEQLRALEKGKNTPVIMLSGVYRAAGHQEKMIERFGVRAYLDKPVELDRLLDVVRASLPLGRPPPARAESSVHRTMPVDGRMLGRVTMRIDMAAELGISPEIDAALRIANMPVPRRGDLVDLPFARLLGQLYSVRATGALMLRRSHVKKIVYLRQGVPIFVKSNMLGECLGHVMVRERLISQQQCDRSVERLKVEKRPQGQILIDMGAISPHNLGFGLERQLELKLYDLFSWLEGKYLFSDKDEYTGTAVALSLSPAEMVFEGVRRTMSAERVMAELARIADRIPLPTEDPTFRYQALELNPRAERLLDAIDGKARLSELLAREILPREQGAVLLYALVSTSLLRLLDAPALPRTASEAEVIALGEADVEALHTGEVHVDVPAMRAVAEAREKARAARESALHPSPPDVIVSEPPPDPLAASAPAQGSSDLLDRAPDRLSAVVFSAKPGRSGPPPVPRADSAAPSVDEAPPAALPPPDPTPSTVAAALDAASALRSAAGVPEHLVDMATGLSRGLDLSADRATELAGELADPDVPEADLDAVAEVDATAVTELPGEAWAGDLSPPPAPAGAALESAPHVSDLAVPREPAPAAPTLSGALRMTVPPRSVPPPPPPEASPDVDEQIILEASAPALVVESREDIRARLEASLTARLAARSPVGAPSPAFAEDLSLPEASPELPAEAPRPRGPTTDRSLKLDLEAEKARRLTELEAALADLSARDHYEVLGVDEAATAAEVTAAFEALARVHHPDRSVPGSAARELRATAEAVYLCYVRARDTLLHAEERRAYDRQRRPLDDPHRVDAKITLAEAAFQRGLAQLDAGELAQAFEAFDDACALAPDEGTYLAYLAWTTFMLAPEDGAERALADLARAADASPRAEEPHVFAGMVEEKLGRRDAAARSFRRALIANPDSVRALRALRALAPPPERKTGLFSRFGG